MTRESGQPEVNVTFVLQRNLVYLPSVTVDGKAGRFFLASAASRSVIDPRFLKLLPARRHEVELTERASLPLSAVSIDLGTTGDAMIGADAWGAHAVTIDYRAGLLTYQKRGIQPGLMTISRFAAEPTIDVRVNGATVQAIVDTALPDTLVLPGTGGRRTAQVAIAGTDFGPTDVSYRAVAAPRVGNRLLSRFLITIDYGRHEVGLWRDPRIPLR